MSRSQSLLHFARGTIERYTSSRIPGALTATALREHYVELRVADSVGKLLPVGDLLRQGARLILVGDPGSGKTTALREFAVRKSEEFLAGTSDILPVFLSLCNVVLSSSESLFSSISLSPKHLTAQPLLLLLDGLDEVPPEDRIRALSLIEDASARYPNSQIILSSRPSGLSPAPPEHFRFYHLESLDSSQVLEVITKLSGDKEQVDIFQASLLSSPFLEGLSRSPLLVQLLWQVFQSNAHLPTVRAELFQTACDFLLYRWDEARGITRGRSPFSIAAVHDLLAAIAIDAFFSSIHRIPLVRIKEITDRYTQFQELDRVSVDEFVGQLLSSGLLIEDGANSVSFFHLSIMEFYVARRLAKAPRELASLIAQARPAIKEVALFAAGMIVDVAPLVEAAVDRRELILAANCLREGRTENRTLEAYVIDQLQRELGTDLIKKLASGITRVEQQQPESIHSQLRRQLAEVRDPTLLPHEKGKLFERFMERLFRQSFDVVDLNTNTENGEIDLILGNVSTDPFWAEWGGDILVECKNWNSSRPLTETAAFAQKVRMSRSKLGFFVSVSGFTEDALRTLKNQVADRDAPLIVPISGAEIELMLDNREKFDLFFRASIRRIKHLHKWQ